MLSSAELLVPLLDQTGDRRQLTRLASIRGFDGRRRIVVRPGRNRLREEAQEVLDPREATRTVRFGELQVRDRSSELRDRRDRIVYFQLVERPIRRRGSSVVSDQVVARSAQRVGDGGIRLAIDEMGELFGDLPNRVDG